MEDLLIEGTEETPTVHLQVGGELSLSGNSYPEDALEFYSPLLSWLDEYRNSPADSTITTFNISYFNSASTMPLLKILSALEVMHKAGNKVQVIWRHAVGDTLMADKAEEMSSLVELPIEIRGE